MMTVSRLYPGRGSRALTWLKSEDGIIPLR